MTAELFWCWTSERHQASDRSVAILRSGSRTRRAIEISFSKVAIAAIELTAEASNDNDERYLRDTGEDKKAVRRDDRGDWSSGPGTRHPRPQASQPARRAAARPSS
jgi:hypothetical protein